MSYTSKKYFEEKFKKTIWSGLLKELRKAKSDEEIMTTLSKVLTSAELNLLEKRLAILYLLNQGLPYRKISEIADVYPNTISFIKKGLKKPARTKRMYSGFPPAKSRKRSSMFRPYRFLRKSH